MNVESIDNDFTYGCCMYPQNLSNIEASEVLLRDTIGLSIEPDRMIQNRSVGTSLTVKFSVSSIVISE